jgi:pseudouridine-5'-phosphate glycosidase
VIALKEANSKGIKGKAVTPFLLSAMAEQSGGRTLKANMALLENNAKIASAIAATI